jgi:hypothetical protein
MVKIRINSPDGEAKLDGEPAAFIERAKAQGLIGQALLIGTRGDEASQEQARLLWEEALNVAGLDVQDKLLCHYSLGSQYLSRRDLPAGILHQEYVLATDPNLDFMTQVDDATKNILRAELYITMSVAYQQFARDVLKENRSLEEAIVYLQEKLNLLRHRAAPSLYLELSSYHSLAGDQDKARQLLQWAIDAPTYGSELQEEVRKTATKLLHDASQLGHGPSRSEEKEVRKKPPGLDFGQALDRAPRRWMKMLLWAVPVVAAIVALVLLAGPSPYRKYYKQALESHGKGNYDQALALVDLAKAKKNTLDLSSLEQTIRARMQEQKEREEQAIKQAEYDKYYRSAQEALNNGNYLEAESNAQLARERIATGQVVSLLAQADAKIQEQRERDYQNQQAAADDAAFQIAHNLGNTASYYEYLRAYPEGRNAAAARNKIALLREQVVQGPVPVSERLINAPIQQYQTPNPVPRYTVADLRNALGNALRRLEERQSASTPRRPNAPTVDISKAWLREKNIWEEKTIRSLDLALSEFRNAAIIAESISSQETRNLINKWMAQIGNTRKQLVSKNLFSNESSFTNQRRIIKEMINFLNR